MFHKRVSKILLSWQHRPRTIHLTCFIHLFFRQFWRILRMDYPSHTDNMSLVWNDQFDPKLGPPGRAFDFRVKTLVSGRKKKGYVILSFSMYIALKNGTCLDQNWRRIFTAQLWSAKYLKKKKINLDLTSPLRRTEELQKFWIWGTSRCVAWDFEGVLTEEKLER